MDYNIYRDLSPIITVFEMVSFEYILMILISKFVLLFNKIQGQK